MKTKSSEAKKTIMIADDSELNRELLRLIFDEKFEIIEAVDGDEAVRLLDECHEKLSILLLDVMMPRKTGIEVMEHMQNRGYISSFPIIIITGEATEESDYKAYEYGASDIIYKPFSPKVVLTRVLNLIELFEDRLHIEEQLEKRTAELARAQEKLKRSNDFLIDALGTVVEFRDFESGEHIVRVRSLSRIILAEMKKRYPGYALTDEIIELIVSASTLHDLGKIAIPDSILLKPGRLTPEEFETMKLHTVYGSELLDKFTHEDDDFFTYCRNIARHHHERYNGRGYPDGLAGEDIPLCAQVVSIVDVFDALVSKRVYKPAYTPEVAFNMIHNGECGVFSPKIIECLDSVKDELIKFTETSLAQEQHNE